MTNIRLALLLCTLIGASAAPPVLAAPVILYGGPPAIIADRGISASANQLPAAALGDTLARQFSVSAGLSAADSDEKRVVFATIGNDGSVVPVEMPMPERSGTLAEFRLPDEAQRAAQAGISTLFGEQSLGRLRARVPEISTWAMMIAGLGLIGLFVRRRRAPKRAAVR